MQSFCGWSLYDGRRVRGRVVATLVRGRVVFRDGEFLAPAGYGRVLMPAGEPADSLRRTQA